MIIPGSDYNLSFSVQCPDNLSKREKSKQINGQMSSASLFVVLFLLLLLCLTFSLSVCSDTGTLVTSPHCALVSLINDPSGVVAEPTDES